MKFFWICLINLWSNVDIIANDKTSDAIKNCSPKTICTGRNNFQVRPMNSGEILNNYLNTNCFCDYLCADAQDCCVGQHGSSSIKRSSQLFECRTPLNQPVSYLMISRCLPNFKNSETKMLCESNTDSKVDPFLNHPVSNLASKIVYKNIYCAQCNGVSNVVFWKILIINRGLVSSLPNNANLINSSNYKKYIKYQVDGTWKPVNSSSFVSLTTVVEEPDLVRGLSRFCKHSIDKCLPTWTDKTVEYYCHAYTYFVYQLSSAVIYKNIHCAICNNVNVQNLKCAFPALQKPQFTPIQTVSIGQISYSLLFDYYYPDGNLAGKNQCGSNQMYDIYSDRCRSFSCGRFAQNVRGSCVPLK